MQGEVSSGGGGHAYSCTQCNTRFKLRFTPLGAEVVWILLDRSLYQSRDVITLYPHLSRVLEDVRCPLCGTDCLKKVQPAASAGPASILQDPILTP